jgi:hypothetical protein
MDSGRAMAESTNGAGARRNRWRSRRAGLVWLIVVGTAWHFVYVLSGSSALVGLVAPVNESVWEHTKLVSIPILAWALWAGRDRGRAGPGGRSRTPVAAVAAALAGSAVVVGGFYAYVAVLGSDRFVLDIAVFVVAVWVALGTLDRLTRRGPALPGWAGLLLVGGLLIGVALLTVMPPDLPMFRVP